MSAARGRHAFEASLQFRATMHRIFVRVGYGFGGLTAGFNLPQLRYSSRMQIGVINKKSQTFEQDDDILVANRKWGLRCALRRRA
jgi:hypothetical protein